MSQKTSRRSSAGFSLAFRCAEKKMEEEDVFALNNSQ